MCVLNNRNLRDDKRPRISLVKGERNVRSDHLSLLDFYIHIRLQIRLALNLVVPENKGGMDDCIEKTTPDLPNEKRMPLQNRALRSMQG